jgi:electron transfer flavoprotein beta subunit
MRIIIPIKQILDPCGILIRRDKERIFINREDYILDPGSKAALEAALRIKDIFQTELIAISMGLPRVDDALREALAMGCDEACLLTDPAFKDVDISVTVHILTSAIKKLGGADMIVTGNASGDTGSGQIGPRLAEALEYGQVTEVCELAIEENMMRATRGWGNGYASVVASLPVVVTVVPDAFPARYPHGARIMNAYRLSKIQVWDAVDLGLDETAMASLLLQRAESFPPPYSVGEVIRGDPDSVAQEMVMALRMQKIIGTAGGQNGL